jgi:hypothetical protein
MAMAAYESGADSFGIRAAVCRNRALPGREAAFKKRLMLRGWFSIIVL